jgi:hypothetical protein
MTDDPVELRTGLPTGAGGPVGEENAGTWSMIEQAQEFADALAAYTKPVPPPPPAPKKGS